MLLLRVLGTITLAWVAAQLCIVLHTPLPWMLGPLLATAVASVMGLPTLSWGPLRNGGQWLIGTALGLYFTPQTTALVVSLWWAIALGILWALGLGALFGLWLQRVRAAGLQVPASPQSRATNYFAAAIGAASEMTLLAERAGARTDLVASAHTLRILLVTLLIPLALQFSGLHGIALTPAGPRDVSWSGFAWLALGTGAGAWLMQRLGRANPWFLGPLLVCMGLTMFEIELTAIPSWMLNAAQLLIGISLGVRFTAGFVHTAPRWLGAVALGTLAMMLVCALMGWAMAWATGLHPATMLLATSPGGIAEMSITAKVLQLGAPVVTAFQVCRLIAVLILVEPLYRWAVARQA
ncbi:AbrB family transcriptional regulator [Variovorax sp. HJSM1_2]|uniref:AbrB family transcriptional regulator n=1 Tax=Variovorax sp. HJSM1_2 TaxID=3366263 RepID=UPI003BC6FBDF